MFATFNIEKIKTVQELNNRYRHNSRKCLKSNKDIDESKIHLNISNDVDAYSEIKNRIKEINEIRKSKGARSLRSDTVVAVEVVLGASGEFWDNASESERLEWLDTNLTWLNDYYEGKGKVVRWDYHLDETSAGNPHIHAIIIPETTDPKGLPTLSAKKLVGTARDMEDIRTSNRLSHLREFSAFEIEKTDFRHILFRGHSTIESYSVGEQPLPIHTQRWFVVVSEKVAVSVVGSLEHYFRVTEKFIFSHL